MRLTVAAVGRWKAGPERALYEHFAGRVTWPLELKEIDVKKKLPTPQLVRREGELLLAAVPKGAVVVALDQRGKPMTSADFARRLGAWRDDGVGDVVFLIGGADGLDESVRKKATLTLSLGPMTWPHLMVRALLAEQLYRAQAILSGHPYHRR
jgi:23S rRNA (pseudouridine1915-N3)-methyltransferase